MKDIGYTNLDDANRRITTLELQLAAQVELADNALFSAREFERENGKLRQSNVSLDQQLKDSEGRCKSRDKVIYSLEQQLAELREENARLCGYDSYQEQQEQEGE